MPSRNDDANDAKLAAISRDDSISGESKPDNWRRLTLIGTILGVALLLMALRNVDTATLIATLQSVDPLWAITLVAAQIAFIAIKAWRWGLLLRFVPNITFKELHASVYAGLAVNYVIAHLGEFLRGVVIARKKKAALSAVFASIFVERALDFLALLVILAIGANFSRQLPELAATAGVIISVIVVIAIGGLFLILQSPKWLQSMTATLTRPLPGRILHWLEEQLNRFRQGLASIRDGKLITSAVLLSILQWSFVVFLMWGSGIAIDAKVSWVAAVATFVLIVVGLTLPNSPLQIGTNQLAFVLGYGIDGIDSTTAVAASFVFTAFALLPTMLIGGLCLTRYRLLVFLRPG